jgi:hypothetical protein
MTLMNCDCKIVRETPESILLRTKLENRALSTRHISPELKTKTTNVTARNLKPMNTVVNNTGVSF